MAVLDLDKLEHQNLHLGEKNVKSSCNVCCLNKQKSHFVFIKYKKSGGRSIPDKLNKLLFAFDTLNN